MTAPQYSGRFPIRMAWLLIAVFLVIALLTFKDYGVGWDEESQSVYGELVVDYFSTSFKDTRYVLLNNLRYYGPSFEAAAALLYRNAEGMKFEIRHLLIAFAASLAFAGLIKYSQLFSNRYLPFFAVLALVTMPRFYGHSFINSKDIPFACFFIWSMYTVTRLLKAKIFLWREFFACGVAFGLAASIRPAGFLLLLFFSAVFASFTAIVHFSRLKERFTAGAAAVFAVKGLFFLVISWALMVAFWPWAYRNIIFNPIISMVDSINFGFVYPTLFEGSVINSDQLPRYYLPKYVLITTPPGVLILAGAGLFFSVKAQLENIRSSDSTGFFMLQFWFLFPLAYFVLMRPNIYDGLRHFLFILPPLAVFAGLGASHIVAEAKSAKKRFALSLVAVVVLLAPVQSLVSLHPYQMTYFNFLVGGVKAASKNYDTDYWVTSYKEAMEWINGQAKRLPGRKTRVLAAANKYNFPAVSYFMSDDIIVSGELLHKAIPGAVPEKYDFYIATTRFGMDTNYPETPVVHEIGRDGAVFAVIKSRHHIPKRPQD